MKSAVLILPIALKEAGNAFGEAQGYGANSYSVLLSSDGATVTHIGLRADVHPEFEARLQNPPPEAAPIMAALIVDISDSEYGAEHFARVLSEHGLEIITKD